MLQSGAHVGNRDFEEAKRCAKDSAGEKICDGMRHGCPESFGIPIVLGGRASAHASKTRSTTFRIPSIVSKGFSGKS